MATALPFAGMHGSASQSFAQQGLDVEMFVAS